MDQFHNYHPETFEYLNSKDMEYSPLDGEPAPPADSTVHPLPTLTANEAAKFDKPNDKWLVVPDFRGTTYFLADGTEVNLELGEARTAEMLDAVPVDIILKRAKELKVFNLYQACSSHILGGFTSDALGAVHTYPSTERDQANLNGVVTESIINATNNTWQAPFWCVDANDLWDRRMHTHVQIQQVGQAAAIHVRGAQDKLKGLVDQVNDVATDTEEKINAINW